MVQSALCFVDLNEDGTYKITESHVEYLNPLCEIPDGAFRVHGISNEMVADKPEYDLYLTHMMDKVNESDVTVIAGYNTIGYDNKISYRFGLNKSFKQLDLMSLGRKMKAAGVIPNAKLVTVYEYATGKQAENAHDALSDITMTLDVLPYALKFMNVNSVTELIESLNSRPTVTMPFGKHKGKEVKDLPVDYVSWLRQNVDLKGNLLDEINKHF